MKTRLFAGFVVILLLVLLVFALQLPATHQVTVVVSQSYENITVTVTPAYLMNASYTRTLYINVNNTNFIACETSGTLAGNFSCTNTSTGYHVHVPNRNTNLFGLPLQFRVEVGNGSTTQNYTQSGVTIYNDIPQVDTITILTQDATSSDNIVCQINGTDYYHASLGNIRANIWLRINNQRHEEQDNVACTVTGNLVSCEHSFSPKTIGTEVFCEGRLIDTTTSGAYESNTELSDSIIIQNSPPVIHTATIYRNGNTLICNYTYTHVDGHDIAQEEYKWYRNNENQNSYVLLEGQIGKELTTSEQHVLFDKDDRIKCAVRVTDNYAPNPLQSLWTESNPLDILDNARPAITNIQALFNGNVINRDNPVNVGQQVTFNVTWFDAEDPEEQARLFVCYDDVEQEDQFSPEVDSVVSIVHDGEDKALWIFPSQQDKYLRELHLTPTMLWQDGISIHAPQTPVIKQHAQYPNEVYRDPRSVSYEYETLLLYETKWNTNESEEKLHDIDVATGNESQNTIVVLSMNATQQSNFINQFNNNIDVYINFTHDPNFFYRATFISNITDNVTFSLYPPLNMTVNTIHNASVYTNISIQFNPKSGDYQFQRIPDAYYFYDHDNTGIYNYDKLIVRYNGTNFPNTLMYHSSNDNFSITPNRFASSQTIPNGQLLRKFNGTTIPHTFLGNTSEDFNSTKHFIYHSGEAGPEINGHIRATYVTNEVYNNGYTFNTYSRPVYDFFVYEVDAYGIIPNMSNNPVMIAKDVDNNFILGQTNIFTFEFNAKPFAGKYVAIKACVSDNNDGVCNAHPYFSGKGENFAFHGNSVFFQASSTPTQQQSKKVAMGTHARNVTFYNPRVSIFYGQSIDNDTIGCVSQTVCSTDTFSSNRNLQCSFTPTMGNQNISRFYAKVCDIGDGQNGRCSIFRNIDVFVNKPPVANITMQYYDASGVAQGNNLSENAQGIINVTHNQSLYCNVDIDTQGNHDSWSTGQDFNVSWYLKMNGVFELCPPNSLSCPVDQDLPSGLLVPGDEWICSATPYNDFIIGQEVNSSIIKVTGVTGDGAQGFETPVLHTVSPPQQNVIKGNDAQITIRYSNIFEDPLRVYVCDYNETPAFFRPSGCIIITEYNRTFTPINPAQNQSFTFNISTEKLKSNNNNLSVVTCTTTNCSTPQHFNVTMQNPIQPNITNWTIQNYTSASDTQTIYPINGIYLINDTDTVFVNYTKNNDTKNVLIQWYIHISDEFVACPFDNPACPVGAFLPSTITMPGQQWFASLTPVNGSYVGPTVNTSIITIKDREVTINASVLGVTSTSQSVMRGEDITVDISFSSFTDNRLRLYICAYNDTTAYYTTSGCIIIHEYYRNITPFVIDPSVTQTYQATFSSATLSTGQNNLTVVLCNEQSCTPQTNNSIHKPQFSVQVNQTLNITYIGLRNNSDSNKAYFDNNRTYLDVPNNLFCNVNFTDVQDNLYANHPTNNISDFTNTQGSLTYRWFYLQNNVFVPFVNNNAVLSNSVIQQIGVTEWKCEVEITETNKPSVTKSSQTVSILQSSSSNDISPEILDITHNAHTHRNENELTTFQIMWRHNDTSITNVTLFICERGLIFPSGCENNELYRTVLTRPASGLTSIVQAPIFSQNENIDLNISIFDKNLQYDFNDTHNVKINNRPTAQNVKTQLNNNILTCTYLYDGNKRTQHIGGHGVESSQNRQVQWYKDGQLLTTQQSNLLSPQGNGIYYCAVKVADVYGLSDDEFVFSNNAQFVGQQSSGLHIYNTYRFVKTNTYNIIGYIDQPDINITAFVYNASDNLQVERNHSNGTSAPLSVLVGTTQSLSSWSIEAQQITLPLSANSLINSSNTGENPRWVEFSNHNRTDGQRYNMTWNTAQNNNIIVNITPPLEHPITSQTEIRIYNESNKTGWFNITVELTQGENNIDVRVNTTPQTWFTVFSRDLPLVFDNTSPEVHITEQWLSTQTRTITAIMNDTIGLDKSSLIFNVSGDVIANNLLQCTEQTLNGLLKNLTCSYSVTNSSGVDINVSISDMAGNVASGNITSQYNPNPPATVQNIKTKDTISQNDTIIRNPFNISWDSVDDILHYRVQIVSYPLTQVLYERNTTHNHTLIQNMSLFVPDNQYQVLVSAVSRYNVEGDQNASSDFTYKTPSIIPLQLLNISGNNQSFVKNNVTYYINNNSSTTSALYFNTSRQNLTCYMTQQRMSVADATSSPQAISQKGNSSNDYTITFTLSHVNQGKKERYIICDYNGLPQEVDEALHIQWYVDTQKPTIQIHSPANKSVVSNPFVLNYTASDLHSGLKNSTVYAVDLFDDTQKTIITNMTIPKISNISRYHIVSYDYVGNTQTKQVWYRKQGTEPLIITDMPTYFNNAINATLIVANANSVSYNIVRNSNGHEEDTESPTIPNNLLIHPINIDTSSYANEIFTFTVTAGNKVYEQLLIKDAIAPTVADTSQPTSMINRTDNLVFTANITENEALKEVYLNITLYNSSNTPMYQNISKLPAIIHDANAKQTNATVHIPSAWLKSITKNWTNNYTIEWQWVAKDQANNMNTTPKQNITVVNRPAYLNITKNISWSFAHTGIQSGATLNLAPYIVNPDGNQLSITHAVLGGQLLRSITNNQLRISGNPGTYQLNITLQDNFGGINTTTLNITITNTQPSCNQASNYILIPSNSCVGTSSSPHDEHHDNTPPQRTGGGGGSIGSTTVLRQTIALANPQQPIDMPIYNTQIPISHIFAQLSKEVRSINMIITPGKPFDVPTPIGYTVHAYARIQHNPLSNTDVTQALITFRVPKHVQQPIILRYTTTWNELPTRLISSDAQFNYYQATSPGLSVFAIATKQQTPPSSPLTGNIVAPPPQPTCYDGIQNQGEQGIDCGGPCAPCETPTIPTQPSTETQHTPLPPQSSWLTWILMAGVLVVVLSGTVGTYVVMQKPKPPELYPISPGMSSIEIYIRKELNKGFSEPHITDALLGIGWKQQTIQEEFDRILGRESHKKLDVEPVQNKPKDVLQEFVATQFFTKSLGVQDAIAQQPWTEHDKQYAQAFLEALQDLAQQVHMWKVKGYTQQMIKDHLLQLEWPLYIIYEMLKR